jgi:hypothetical protein
MSIFSYKNPADSAKPYIDQIPGTIKPYYEPYVNSGQDALSTLIGQYFSLINNPSAKLNEIGSGYTESPGYEFQKKQALTASNNAAAAGGMLGTPASQEQAESIASSLADQDYNTYLGNAEGLYKTGLTGEEGVNRMGYQASNELAQSLANALLTQGTLAYKGTEGENASNAGMVKGLTSLAGALLGFL